jgi:hypothetical protein
MERTARRTLAPQPVDQAVAGDGLRRVEGKQRNDRVMLGAAKRDPLPVMDNFERAEDSEFQGSPNPRWMQRERVYGRTGPMARMPRADGEPRLSGRSRRSRRSPWCVWRDGVPESVVMLR